MIAGRVVDEAMKAGTVAGADLADRYRDELARTFVLKTTRSCGEPTPRFLKWRSSAIP